MQGCGQEVPLEETGGEAYQHGHWCVELAIFREGLYVWSGGGRYFVQASLAQQDVLRRLVRQVKDFGAPPSGKSSQEALMALRAAASGYLEPEAGVGDVVSMCLESLSLPTCQVGGLAL